MQERVESAKVKELLNQRYDDIFISYVDVDQTFVQRGLTQAEVEAQVGIYRETLISICRNFDKQGKRIKIRTVFLTTRPIAAFTNLESNLHPLLGITDISTDSLLSESLEGVNQPATFLCEQGTVILSRKEQLAGEFEDLGNGYGVQVVDRYQPYCNGPRINLLDAIEKTGILGDDYQLEPGTYVNVSIQRKDEKPMDNDTKYALMDTIIKYLLDNHSGTRSAIIADSSGNDLDIFPQSIYDLKKKEALDAMQDIITEESAHASKIHVFLADDSFSAVEALLPSLKTFTANEVKMLVADNADPKLLSFAAKSDLETVFSAYPTFDGYRCSLYEAIMGRKLPVSVYENKKVQNSYKSRPVLMCVGDYAQIYFNQAFKKDRVHCERETARFTSCEELLTELKRIEEDLLTYEGGNIRFSDLLSGMRLVISINYLDAREATHYKTLVEYLGFHHNFQDPIPLILISLTKNKYALKYARSGIVRVPQRANVRGMTRKRTVLEEDEMLYAFAKFTVHADSKNPYQDIEAGANDLTIDNFIAEIDLPEKKKA